MNPCNIILITLNTPLTFHGTQLAESPLQVTQRWVATHNPDHWIDHKCIKTTVNGPFNLPQVFAQFLSPFSEKTFKLSLPQNPSTSLSFPLLSADDIFTEKMETTR